MSIREKYSTTDWVISVSRLKEGDWLAYEEYGIEVHATYVGEMDGADAGTIVVMPEGRNVADIISYHNTVVYRLNRNKNDAGECSCGARFTSNPKFHLKYCNIGE